MKTETRTKQSREKLPFENDDNNDNDDDNNWSNSSRTTSGDDWMKHFQKQAASIVLDFPDFQPQNNNNNNHHHGSSRGHAFGDAFDPPDWLSNPHVQTIGGYLCRLQWNTVNTTTAYIPRNMGMMESLWTWLKMFIFTSTTIPTTASSITTTTTTTTTTTSSSFWDRRERIETPDGDWFHADTKFWSPHHEHSHPHENDDPSCNNVAGPARCSKGTVILLHGLESNSNSPAVMEMAQAFIELGLDCTCLNFRGCSGIPNDRIGGYHLGFTQDLKQYLQMQQQQQQQQQQKKQIQTPIYLSGFSLGANVVLKCLGELGVTAAQMEWNIAGAAVLCAPLDQIRNAPQLAMPGINRDIYSRNLLRTMKARAKTQCERFLTTEETCRHHHKIDLDRVLAATNITEFDDAFIAPIYNYTDCWDYYHDTSSVRYIERIAVPTYVLNARDDPFFDNSVWPVGKTVFAPGGAAPLKLARTESGGHLGFWWHQVDPQDPRLQSSTTTSLTRIITPSWAPRELSRFVQHVQRHREKMYEENDGEGNVQNT
jgi:hypothetical protein